MLLKKYTIYAKGEKYTKIIAAGLFKTKFYIILVIVDFPCRMFSVSRNCIANASFAPSRWSWVS